MTTREDILFGAVEKRPVQVDGSTLKGVWALCRTSGNEGPEHQVRTDYFPGRSVGDGYQILQDSEVADLIRIITDEPFEVAEPSPGKTVFQVKLDEQDVLPGDSVQPFVWFLNYHGAGSFRILSTCMRWACHNQERMAWSKARNSASVPHRANVRQRASEAAEAFRQAQSAFDDYIATARSARKVVVDPAVFINGVLDSVLNVTEAGAKAGADALASAIEVTGEEERLKAARKWARRIRERGEVLDTILNLYDSETNTAPGSLWAAHQAVTEYSNHHIRYRQESQQVRMNSILNGRAAEFNSESWSRLEDFVR